MRKVFYTWGSGMGKTNEKLQLSCPGAKLMEGKVWKKDANGSDLAVWAENPVCGL